MEEDQGFVLVSKDGLAEDDDAGSMSSSRSSLFLVDDPAKDRVLLHGEEEEAPKQPVQPPPVVSETKAEDSSVEEVAEDPDPEPEVATESKAEAVENVEAPKYVCSGCNCDVASSTNIIWEGYMGANKAAFLFGKVLNTEPAAPPRQQQLSTGTFLLQDVRCRTCSTPFGWSYLKAWNEEQKYKEGTTIVQQSLLQLVPSNTTAELPSMVRC